MASQTNSGVIGGAAQGAMAGAPMGPIGMFAGAAIGAIGGFIGGQAAKKALAYQNKAAQFEKRSKLQQAALQRRDMLRNARMQQAQAIAFAASEEGGLQSSASQGARASGVSQLGFNLGYMENQVTLQSGITKFLEKAGKSTTQAQDAFAITSTVTGALGTLGPRIPQRPPSGIGANVGGLGVPLGGVGAGGYQPATSPTSGIGLTVILDERRVG